MPNENAIPVSPAEARALLAPKCPVCGDPAKLQLTNGRGIPYQSCDRHQIQALALLCRQRGYKTVRHG
jgi:C4-type Zn-finger protein